MHRLSELFTVNCKAFLKKYSFYSWALLRDALTIIQYCFHWSSLILAIYFAVCSKTRYNLLHYPRIPLRLWVLTPCGVRNTIILFFRLRHAYKTLVIIFENKNRRFYFDIYIMVFSNLKNMGVRRLFLNTGKELLFFISNFL